MDIEYLINNLMSVITYLASGFLFIKLLLYVRNSEDGAAHNVHYLLPSVVVSYIIKLIVDLSLSSLGISLSDNVFCAVLLGVAAIMGFLFGKMSKSKLAECVMVKMFGRTTKIDFWEDVPSNTRRYTIKYRGQPLVYNGYIIETDGEHKTPLIKMCGYVIYDGAKVKVEDHSNSMDDEIILSTENIEYMKSASACDEDADK